MQTLQVCLRVCADEITRTHTHTPGCVCVCLFMHTYLGICLRARVCLSWGSVCVCVLSPGVNSELGVWVIWLCSQAFLEPGEAAKPDRLSQGFLWLEGITHTYTHIHTPAENHTHIRFIVAFRPFSHSSHLVSFSLSPSTSFSYPPSSYPHLCSACSK